MFAYLLFLFMYLLISERISSSEKVKLCRRKDRLITARETDLYEFVDAIDSQEIILQCHYCFEKGNLDPKIWYKQDRPFLKDPVEIKITKTVDPDHLRIMINPEHSLIIKNYSSHDEGIYYCLGGKGWESEDKINYFVDTIIGKRDIKVEVGDSLKWKSYQEKYLNPMNEFIRAKIKEYKNLNPKYNLKLQLEVMTQWEAWGPCVICGLPIGQRRRLGKCRLHSTIKKSRLTKARHIRKQVPGEDEFISQEYPTGTAGPKRSVTNTSSSNPSPKLTIDEIFRFTPTLSCRSLQVRRAKEISQELFEEISAIPEYVQIESCYGVCEEGRNLNFRPEGKGRVATKEDGLWGDEMSYEASKEAEKGIMEEYSVRTRGPKYIHLKKGDALRLVCPGASASSVVVWKKNGKVIGASGWMDYSTVDALGTLHIESVSANDTGSYLCAVDGSDRLVVSVEVKVSKYLSVEGLLRRCFSCRSRGDLGTCKDPFTYNSTTVDETHGVVTVPCASGWCGKILEGGNTFKDDDYGMATQRLCLQRGPSDSEERCAYTEWSNKKVFMCFCLGDLCNASSRISNQLAVLLPAIAFTLILIR